MKPKEFRKVLSLCLMGLPATMFAAITVNSPNNQIALSIDVQNNTPVYSVSKNGHNVINQSKLGVKYGNDEYYNFNSYQNDGNKTVSDDFTLSHGKRSTYQNSYLEQTVTFKNSGNGRQLTMVFRVYDDAVAFRYTKKDGGNGIIWDNEQSEFNFNGFQKCWVQNAYDAGYSVYFQGRSWNDINKTTYQDYQYGYCVPMLVQTGNNDSWCLLTESAALSSIAASTIVKGDVNGGVKLEIVKHGNKLGSNAVESKFNTPFESPWRTIIIGSLNQIVESTATQNLSPATLAGDWSWVKPGRVAWNWAAEDSSNNLNSAMCRRYTDMAAHFGWEYNLLDEGWEGRLNVQDEVNYAKARNVGLILWFNQNHFKSDYTSIYNEMKKYADMGVKGFKIDFFEDDRQDQLVKYERMLDAAKELKLVINFHGCTKPSGLDRTWPNLLTMEANYGGEMYMFWPNLTPAYHMVNLALTRNVLGSMDYTPLKWGMSTNSVRSIDNSTWAQQLALTVAYETGEFHPSDTPENLDYSVAEPVLKMLPVAWDDIKCLDAQPDQYVTIARKKGNNWWVATIANDARTATISTDYLDAGKTYYAHIYRDGDYRYEVKSEVRQGITKGTNLTIPLLKYGGALVVFTTDANVAYPHDRTYEAEYYNQGGTIENDNRVFAGKYVSNLNANNKIVFTDVVAQRAGQYAVTLYYRANSATKAYVQANDGAKVQMNMVQPGVRDGSHPGENIGFRTALVYLNKGLNTLTIANDQGGNAPMVDHITVRPTAFPAAQASDILTIDGKKFANAQTIEGESGNGDGSVQNDAKCSGGQRLNDLTNGKKRTYTINVNEAGVYDFNVFYMTGGDRALEVAANGKTVKINCPSSGSWDGNGIKYATASLHLNAGQNTFTLGNATDNAPNIDHIDVVLAASDAKDAIDNIVTIEAESGVVNGAAVNGDVLCSGEKFVGNLGNNAGTVSFNYNAETAGEYDITISYMTAANRGMYVQVNNGEKTLQNFDSTGSWDGTNIGQKVVRVTLNKGNNTIVLGNDTDWAPNVDKIEVKLVSATSSTDPVVTPSTSNNGIFDWAGYLGVNDERLKNGELIQRNGDVYVLAKDLDGVGNPRRAIAVVNKSNQTQQVIVSGQRLGYEKDFVIDGKDTKYALNVNVNAGAVNVYTLTGVRREQTRFEAENAAINDYDNNGKTANNRFTNVFQQNADANSSNGFVVGWLGYFPDANNGNPADCYLQWDNVYSKTGGEYFVTLNYFTSANRGAAIYVNGQKVQEWNNLNSGSFNTAGSQTVKVNLKKGANTIKVGYAGYAGNAQIDVPNIDFIDVVRAFNVSGNLTQTDFYQYGSSVMQDALKVFYNNGKGNDAYQWSNHYQKGSNDRGAIENIWWQGYAMATFAEFAKAARTTADYNTYSDMIAKMAALYPNFVKDIDGRVCWMMRPGYGHRFSDDDAWASIGLLEAYDLEHKQFYLDQVRMFGEYAWKLWDDKGNGGMYWQDSPDGDTNTFITKNAANNNPTCVIFTRLYEITGEKVWLDRAIQTYQWIYDVLLDKNDMQVRDNINVNTNGINGYKGAYNQGSFINAAVLLYRATGDQKYLDHALACAQRLNNNKFENYNSAQYGNIRIAKADGDMLGRDVIVIARGYEELTQVINDRTYINTIKNTMLNAYAERRDAECGLIKDGWKGDAGQRYDNKDDFYEGLIQLGFLEMFARLAVNDDYEQLQKANYENPNDVVANIEAENTTKAAGVTTNNNAAASNGQFVGFVGNGKSLTFNVTAPVTGTYQLISYYCTAANRDFTISVNGDVQTLKGVTTGSYNADTMSPLVTVVTLNEGDNQIVIDAAGDAPNFDKFVIASPVAFAGQTEDSDPTETPDPTPATVVIKMSSLQGTYSSEYDLDFNNSNLKAYVASGYNAETGFILLSRVYEVPAGTGLLLKGETGDYELPIVSHSYWFYNNLFKAVVKSSLVLATEDEYVNYCLAGNGANAVSFYSIKDSVTLGDNRAYLQVPASLFGSNGVRNVINLQFEDETTGIDDVKSATQDDTRYFDLQGRRVDAVKKGFYIRNGKKVIR